VGGKHVDVDLSGKRVLVVGGSAGIGRGTALAAAEAGAAITVVGRSAEKLAEVVTTAGTGTGIAADVTDPDRCRELIGEAVDAMGGIDALVYSTGVSPLAPLEEVDAETWQRVITTNAIGPALVTQAALPHLGEDGVVVFLSSISVGGGYFGLGPYQASKAALDRTVQSWRAEHPEHRFVRMAVGDTEDTDFARDFDMERAAALTPKWVAASVIYKNRMVSADLGRTITEFIAMLLAHPGLTIPELTIVPSGGMLTMEDVQELMATLAENPAIT
jgi:NAD(P)-dependent dehydrogenase (short-subunit alcohol dehydrogenase family)